MVKVCDRIMALYMPGVDLRRIDAVHSPYLSGLMKSQPWKPITTLPSSELLSTSITGLAPHQHKIWQAKLTRPERLSFTQRLIDALPDFLTTTCQCTAHMLTRGYDMSTIPPRRRRQLTLTRIKFHGGVDTDALRSRLNALGNPDSVLKVMGENCRYLFTDRLKDAESLIANTANGGVQLEFVQFHPIDIMEHWYCDTEEKFRRIYGRMDHLIRALHAKCAEKGVTLAIISDHGQERVRRIVDMKAKLRDAKIPDSEYMYFMQAILTRFWFFTERARQRITERFSDRKYGTLLTNRDLEKYGIRFPDTDFGELYFLANPGTLFFPDDFYHPLVNVYFGLKDWQKRRRLRSPIQLGYHGYLPHHESERGVMVLCDDRLRTDDNEMHLIDLAPTLLNLLGYDKTPSMQGQPRFLPT